jgi:hypothetical protein
MLLYMRQNDSEKTGKRLADFLNIADRSHG